PVSCGLCPPQSKGWARPILQRVVREENVSHVNPSLGLAGFSFSDLYDPLRLRDLHAAFWKFAAERRPGIEARFAGVAGHSLTKPEHSDVLIEVAGLVGEFLSRLFEIDSETRRLRDETLELEKIFQFKQDFLRTRVFKNFDQPAVDEARFLELDAE